MVLERNHEGVRSGFDLAFSGLFTLKPFGSPVTESFDKQLAGAGAGPCQHAWDPHELKVAIGATRLLSVTTGGRGW
jgi:hypothetical protein